MHAPWLVRGASATALILSCSLSAQAAVIGESEPNDTYATAQVVAATATANTTINGGRTFADPSDDFFRFFVPAFTTLRISSSSPTASADSILGLFGPTGLLLASNDDGVAGTFMSALSYFTGNVGGLFTIGFSGYNPGILSCGAGVTSCYDTNNDFVFDTFVAGGGAGGSTGWLYSIAIDQVAAVPEPPLVALLALGLAVAFIPRRARRDVALPA